MKANELRIGNWVMQDDKLPYQIWGGHLDGFDIDDEIEYIFGIPLTPEILEKAGFRDNGNGFYWLGDFDDETGGYMYDNVELYYFHYDCPNERYALKLPKYLHWLQNHYYFTKGKELAISL
jgi:hypothetical protein